MKKKILEERFVLPVGEEFEKFVELAFQRSRQNPSQAFQVLGLTLPWLEEDFAWRTIDYIRNPLTPPEVFPFAVGTQNGTQIGFLADTGLESTKDCAIVMVSKQQEQNTFVFASNFKEFLSLLLLGNVTGLETLPEDDVWLETAQSLKKTEFQKEREELEKELTTLFELTPITSPKQTVLNAQNERKKKVTLESGDGLGVIQIPGNRTDNQPISALEASKRLSRKKLREEILFQMSLELDTMIASGAYTAAIGSSRNLLKVAGSFKCGNVLKQVTSSVYSQCSLNVLSEAIICTPYPE